MDYLEILQSFGFPIAACVVLIVAIRELMKFLAKQYEKITADNKEREAKYIEIYTESAKRNEELVKANSSFVEALNDMRKSLTSVEADVDDIKDYLDLNRRNSDKREDDNNV